MRPADFLMWLGLSAGLYSCAALAEPALANPPPKEWRFNALLDGKPIGEHHYTLERYDNELELFSEATFSVKYLYIEFYSYHHTARERWQSGCLNELRARTEEQGDITTVDGDKNADGFLVRDAKGERELGDPCVSTYAYWDIAMLQRQRLLNPQTGEWLEIKVQPLGNEAVQTSKRSLTARHYRVITDKARIDLWYSTQDEWIGLQSTTPEGRLVTYQLIE